MGHPFGYSRRPQLTIYEEKVLEVVHNLLAELEAERALSQLTLDSSFDRDLGLGSLERVEVLLRIEDAFSLRLPDTTMAEAQTPRELARLISHAEPQKEERVYKRRPRLERASIQPKLARTLTESLFQHAETNPNRPHIYLSLEKGEEKTITYGALLDAATAVGRGLLERGLQSGETVAIMLPTGEGFFNTFLGTLLAGGVPVPIYPPFRPDQIREYAQRQSRILHNAAARYLITFREAETLAHLLRPQLPNLSGVSTPETLAIPDSAGRFQGKRLAPSLLITEEIPALIQYTSGSTGDPKGVLLTHWNLLSNIWSMGQALQVSPSDVGVSWLPLYHDMGLIGSWLFCLYFGIPIAILSPLSFLSRPERWLWAVHTYRATLSPAPNFGYEICATRIKDEAIEGLDLSSWRIALNGAEPVSPETLARFTKRFSRYGFRPETFLPVYGLAEASVGLTFPHIGRTPRIDRISREVFERERRAEPASPSESSPLEFVSCGMPLPDHQVRIVDEAGKEVDKRMEGQVEFSGPSCTSGYYRNLEATRSLFHDGWLTSGDLGYWADGELFITGRKKDVIIKGGRNLYPHEMEEAVGDIPGVRKGCVAAFGIKDPKLGTEKLIIVAETKEEREEIREQLTAMINDQITSTTGIPPDLAILVPPGTVPKTSSGKIQRAACREAYLTGRLISRRRLVQVQIAELLVTSFWSWTRRQIASAVRFLYAAYVGLALIVTLMPVWAFVVIRPPGQGVAGLLRHWARLFLRLTGCFPRVEGDEQIRKGPLILLANHASYIDAGILIAVLPKDVRFVAKKELLNSPVIGTFIRKAGHLTVDRMDVSKSISDTQKIESVLQGGSPVLIFPEGTFGPAMGLGPFKLGAFKVAVESGLPVCPIALKGTRQVLRPGQWLPNRGKITVIIGKPIAPKGTDWREVVRLRDTAKTEMSRRFHENP